ncbi:hypothetical protein PPYR_00803 [Photinus pyralis]|uniref:cardiolipin synthase (CMP-forming) n=1 Tax=Photinus pyralis TaxID=7054 RepID=A0A1Y1LY92_PHOPY|nr:probable cardiolipin synthase (CMP-forming) [Photinus pyralis]KAB0803833.1 hypothetical protein PPYR_00803 [Photinus pyralis]
MNSLKSFSILHRFFETRLRGCCDMVFISYNPKVNFTYFHMNKYLQKHQRFKFQTLCTVHDKGRPPFDSKNVKKEIQSYIRQKQIKLKATEQRIKVCGETLRKDFVDTKNKVKEKVEEVIERENIYTIPNFLCVSRILLSPYLGLLIVQAEFHFALALLGVAAVTDLLDGWIARTWASQSSIMGSFLDPMADKVLIATLFLSLTYADLIPVSLTGLILLRDVLLVAAALALRYKSLSSPRTMGKLFDISHATVQIKPTFISKINTGVQLALVGSTLAAPVFHYVGHPLLQSLWYITAATTIAGGLSYILSKNTYKIIKKKNNKT